MTLATNIFELFGKIGADDKPAISAIDNVVAKAQSADHTLSNGLNKIGSMASSAGEKLTNMITKPAVGAAAALGSIALVKGFNRLTGIDDARAKLLGLGHDGQSVEEIMKSALTSVKGTSFGMDEAATTAAGAVAAGVEQGESLTKYLSLTADAAAIAGTSMSEMGSIINKVQTGQQAYTDDLNQLADRGLPIYQWLAEEAGVAAGEVKALASEGKISSEMFLAAIEKNIGGAAAVMGENSFKASIANIAAAFGRIGANFLDAGGKGGGFFSTLKPLMSEFLNSLGGLEEKATEFGVKFGESFQQVVNFVMDLKAKFDALDPSMQQLVVKSAGMWAGMAVGAGPALQVFGKYTETLSKVSHGFETMNGVVKGVPGLAQAAFGSAGSSLEGFKSKVSSSKTGIDSLLSSFKSIGSGSLDVFKNLIPDSLLGKVSNFKSMIGSIPTGALAQVGDKVGEISFKFGTWSGRFDNSGIFGKVNSLKSKLGELSPALGKIGSGFSGIASQAAGVTGVVSGLSSKLVGLGSLAFRVLGPAAIIGGLIAGLGVAQTQFGDQLDTFFQMAQTKGPMIIQGLINGINSKLPELMAKGTTLILNFVETITANLPTIIQSGSMLIFNLVAGVAANIPRIIPVILELANTLIRNIILVAPTFLNAGLQIILALAQGISENLPTFIQMIADLVPLILQTLTRMLPMLLEVGLQLIDTLIKSVSENIPLIIQTISVLIPLIVHTLMELLPQLIEGGLRMMMAIVQGVSENLPMIIQLITEMIPLIVETLIQMLPQLIEVGILLFTGLAQGLIEAIPVLIDAIPQLLQIVPIIWESLSTAFSEIDWGAIGTQILDAIFLVFGELTSMLADVFSPVTDWLSGKKEEISQKFSDIATGMQTGWDSTKSFFSDVAGNIGQSFDSMKQKVSEIPTHFDQAKQKVSEVLGSITGYFQEKFGFLLPYIQGIFNGILTYFTGVFELIKNAVLGPILLIVSLFTGGFDEMLLYAQQIGQNILDAIGLMWTGIQEIFSNSVVAVLNWIIEGFTNIASSVWEKMSEVAQTISDKWTEILTWLSELPGRLYEWAVNTFEQVKTAVSTKMTEIYDKIVEKWNAVITWMSELPGRLWDSATAALQRMLDGIVEKATEIKDMVADGWNSAIEFLENIDLVQLGRDAIDGFIDGIWDTIGDIGDAVSGVADSVVGGLKDLLDINSPSRVMRDQIGRFIPQGIAAGITEDADSIQKTLDNVAGSLAFNPDINPELLRADDLSYKLERVPMTAGITGTNQQPFASVQRLVESVNKLVKQIADQPIIVNVTNEGDLDFIRSYVNVENALDETVRKF